MDTQQLVEEKRECRFCGNTLAASKRSDAKYCNNRCSANHWTRRNPEKIKKYNRKGVLLLRYGMTQGDYDKMLKKQGGVCAICGSANKRVVIDHNHETGKVRGLLCHGCNTAIGYLEKHTSKMWRYIGGEYEQQET